jgi:hypothetical protein
MTFYCFNLRWSCILAYTNFLHAVLGSLHCVVYHSLANLAEAIAKEGQTNQLICHLHALSAVRLKRSPIVDPNLLT